MARDAAGLPLRIRRVPGPAGAVEALEGMGQDGEIGQGRGGVWRGAAYGSQGWEELF